MKDHSRSVVINRAELKSLEIDHVTVTGLRAADVTPSDSLHLPDGQFHDRSRPLMEDMMSRESRMAAGVLPVVEPNARVGLIRAARRM